MSPDVCIPNIGPAQRRLRARFGMVSLATAVGAWVGVTALGLPAGLRLFAVPLLFGGFQGLIQAREKT
jgi:hypothetical protein